MRSSWWLWAGSRVWGKANTTRSGSQVGWCSGAASRRVGCEARGMVSLAGGMGDGDGKRERRALGSEVGREVRREERRVLLFPGRLSVRNPNPRAKLKATAKGEQWVLAGGPGGLPWEQGVSWVWAAGGGRWSVGAPTPHSRAHTGPIHYPRCTATPRVSRPKAISSRAAALQHQQTA